MRKAACSAAGAVLALCALLFSVLTAFLSPAFDIKFYEKEFDKHNVYEAVNVHKDEVMRVTGHMIDYFKNKNDDLQVLVSFGYNTPPMFSSSYGPFFSDRAVEHMRDVKTLVRLGRFASAASAAAALIILIYAAFNRKSARVIRRAMVYCAGGIVALGGVIAFIVSRDFDAAFTKFHEMFFTNDLWLLDWDDRLLNIVPTGFFTDLAFKGGITALPLAAALLVIFFIILRALGGKSSDERNPVERKIIERK